MNSTIIQSSELLGSVCSNLHSVRSLALFAQVNKGARDYLMGMSGREYWTDAGRVTVGEPYWVPPPKDGDAMYYTKIQICPWMSEASTIPIQSIARGKRNSGSLYVSRIRISKDGDEKMLLVSVSSDDPMSFVVIPAVDDYIENRDTASDAQRRRIVFPADHVRDYPYMDEADDAAPFDLRDSGLEESFYNKVFKVHRGVFAVVLAMRNDDNTISVSVHFMSYRTKRILHTLILDTAGVCGVLFLPGGRMYLANGDGLDYYGPRKDRMLRV